MHSLTNGGYKASDEEFLSSTLDDLAYLEACSSQQDVDKAKGKCCHALTTYIKNIQKDPSKSCVVS